MIMSLYKPGDIVVCISEDNKSKFIKAGMTAINYQYLTYQNRWTFLNNYNHVFLDEVYMMDKYVVF